MRDTGLPAPIPPASASGARKGWRCPDEETLAAWVEGSLPEARREKLEGHVADCAFCCGQLGFLVRAGEFCPPPAVPAHLLAAAQGERAPLFGRLRPATQVAAGAGLVLALLVAAPWPGSTGVRPIGRPGVESPADPGTARDVRSLAAADAAPRILFPTEGLVLSRDALALRWQGIPDALFYTVQVVDADGDVAWEGRAESASLAVSASAPLVTGRPYFAWVFAHLRSGVTVSSPAVGFRLAPG